MAGFKIAVVIAAYLVAIVTANLVIEEHGKDAVLYVAAGMIAFTLVARDLLHDLFGEGRFWKMGLLIGTGALLSYLLNAEADKIALASAVAFGASETIDAIAYHVLRRREWLERSNASNLASATVDTLIFFQIAFGDLPFELVFAQIACKVAGGLVWSLLMRERMRPAPA